jgi:transposase InsO family protein
MAAAGEGPPRYRRFHRQICAGSVDDELRLRLPERMSRRGNCYDNAVMESFFGTFKTELGEDFENAAEAKAMAFDFIEIFYNQQRMHSTLGYVSPAEYERAVRMGQAA